MNDKEKLAMYETERKSVLILLGLCILSIIVIGILECFGIYIR